MANAIVSSIQQERPDAIMLCLHGAMVTESYEDGEGELLSRIRQIAPTTPIAITLDMHANVSDAIAECADTIAGYVTYPHEDQYETAMRAGKALLKMMRGEVTPVTSLGRLPLISHVMRQSTLDPYPGKPFKTPNKAIQARAMEMESSVDKCLCASVFVGFPHADIKEAGMSVVVVVDGDEVLAKALRDELIRMIWESRYDFVYNLEPLCESLNRAKQLAEPTDSTELSDEKTR